MKPVEVYKQTQDDWYPSYQIESGTKLVKVSFFELEDSDEYPEKYRVCAWGDDDIGMEKDFILEGTAWNTFLVVIGMEYVNVEDLKKLGFTSA